MLSLCEEVFPIGFGRGIPQRPHDLQSQTGLCSCEDGYIESAACPEGVAGIRGFIHPSIESAVVFFIGGRDLSIYEPADCVLLLGQV